MFKRQILSIIKRLYFKVEAKNVNNPCITLQRAIRQRALSETAIRRTRNPQYILLVVRVLKGSHDREVPRPRRTLHVIPRKVAKRACAVPFPTNLSALTNRSATPCVVGEVHLRRSSSLKTNARPERLGPAGTSTFLRRRARNGYGILGPFVVCDTSRSFLIVDSLSRLQYHRVSLADNAYADKSLF